MAAIEDLERLLERLFERTSARVFRSRVQAVQVERRVERAMEAGRTGRGHSTIVPSRFRVRLDPADLDDLATRTGGPEALAAFLADRSLAFARIHGYHLTARPTVSVVADPTMGRGLFEVDALEGSGRLRSPQPKLPPAPMPQQPMPAPPTLQPLPGATETPQANAALGAKPSPGVDPAPDVMPPSAKPLPANDAEPTNEAKPATEATPIPDASEAVIPATIAPEPLPPPVPAPLLASAPSSSIRAAGVRPYTVRPAAPPPARAVLRVSEPGGREREVRVAGDPLTLGRAPDNGLVIADARVSRHHGRFQNRHGTLVYTDLGSTNGTRVNGIRVDEIVLGAGDRIQVGDVVVVVEHLPG